MEPMKVVLLAGGYGTRISEVARNIMSSVKFALESSLGVEVIQVNVTVQGIRVSK